MNRILEIAPDGSWARVQPGLVMGVLNAARSSQYGTFFAPNPSSENYCSLGGMIGNNSSGARSVAYGGTKDHVLALEVVLSGGEVVQRAAAVERDGAELAALPGRADSVAGRAFAEILPLLRGRSATAIAAAMPRVVKNCSGYRVETVLDDGTRPICTSCSSAPRGRWAWSPRPRSTWCRCPAGGPSPWPTSPPSSRPGRRSSRILALKPTSLEIMDSSFLAFVRKHNRQSTPCCPRTSTPPCSSSSRRPTTPSSTRSSPPWTRCWPAARRWR